MSLDTLTVEMASPGPVPLFLHQLPTKHVEQDKSQVGRPICGLTPVAQRDAATRVELGFRLGSSSTAPRCWTATSSTDCIRCLT